MSLPSSETASKALLKHTMVINCPQYELLIEQSKILEAGLVTTSTAKQTLPIKVNSQHKPPNLHPERTTAPLLLDRIMPTELITLLQ